MINFPKIMQLIFYNTVKILYKHNLYNYIIKIFFINI